MRNIRIYLFVGLLAFFPFWSANAALNSYLKLDGASSGPSKATSTGASSGASAGTVTTQPAPPPGGSRDIYLDIKDIEGESAAGPAILEIDTVRGESPENSPPDSTDRLKNSELIDDWPISADAADVRRLLGRDRDPFLVRLQPSLKFQGSRLPPYRSAANAPRSSPPVRRVRPGTGWNSSACRG